MNGTDRLPRRGRSPAAALVGAQAITAVIAAAIAWIGSGPNAAMAAMFGGATIIVPTLYFAVKVHLRTGAVTAAEVLGVFYRAEVVKLILSALLFWIGALLYGRYFAPLMLTAIACLAMNWIIVAVTQSW